MTNMSCSRLATAEVPLAARVLRAAFIAASAWTFAAVWSGWTVVHTYDRHWFGLPGWAYWPTHYAFWLLKETYLPILGALTLIWGACIFAPIGRWRWLVVAIACAMAITYLWHSMPEVRE
jgi:hypothetical protein